MSGGLFVSVEGIDGSGKSTQARLLAEELRRQGLTAMLVRDPGTTELGERIRELLLTGAGGSARPEALAEVALFLAARVQLLAEVIRPALDQGAVVVADRYLDSTLAYQGAGRGIGWQRLLELHHLVGASLLPDLTLLLDLPVAAARGRLDLGLPLDRLESEPTPYHELVREGYLALAQRFPGRVVVLDAKQAPELVAQQCSALTRGRIEARRLR